MVATRVSHEGQAHDSCWAKEDGWLGTPSHGEGLSRIGRSNSQQYSSISESQLLKAGLPRLCYSDIKARQGHRGKGQQRPMALMNSLQSHLNDTPRESYTVVRWGVLLSCVSQHCNQDMHRTQVHWAEFNILHA